jgi:hypothetical protein
MTEYPFTEDFVALFSLPDGVRHSMPYLEMMLSRTAQTGKLPSGVDPADKRVQLIRDALMATGKAPA